MKATLDHIGIAVGDLPAALAFFRDALGLHVEDSEEIASQRVRAHFVPVGQSSLELLEATGPDSPIAKYIGKRGPGLHHITLRVDDIKAALAQLSARGVRLIDSEPRAGAEGSLVAFVHPSSAQGVLVELKQGRAPSPEPQAPTRDSSSHRYTVGDLELISLCDGYMRLDGGAMFGVVPRTVWETKAPADERNRVVQSVRPLVVRGARTMIIDAGVGDKEDDRFCDTYGVEREHNLDRSLAEVGLSPEDIDIVLATHLHFDHAGGFTKRNKQGKIVPRFPRAQYVVRRREWEDATHPNERNLANYLQDNFVPLAQAGVLQLMDEDTTIMPGVKVRRTGGHTMGHQVAVIESGGKTAVYVADILPMPLHVSPAWSMGFDLYPVDTLAFKKAFIQEALERQWLLIFEHDLDVIAGRIREHDGKFRVVSE